jgi:membrane protease YdiL (CAAX protease family)
LTALAASRSGTAGQRAVLLGVGLGTAALARAALNGTGATSAYLAGTGFGAVLLCLAFAAGWRPARPRPASVGLGILGGVILIGLPLLAGGSTRAVPGMRPEPFAAWLVVTALVVTAEEVLLRGALLPALDEAAGPVIAVVASSAAFALIHVPLYGWSVVPIDLGAGVWLAGLRYLSGGLVAPTLAHFLADVATRWL